VHERRASAYAEAKGWEIVEVYRLEAVSGKSVGGHREAKRMLEDVRRGHITGLIFPNSPASLATTANCWSSQTSSRPAVTDRRNGATS
jgi:hypothetical protein